MLKSLSIFFLFFLAFGAKDISLPSEQPINLQTPETDQISIPLLLNYQGKITDNIGNPVRDSSYSVTFRLFNVPSGGTAFWNETQTIQTRAGLFHTLLGSVTPIPSLPLDGNLYLEMQVNPNPAMTPRVRIVSSAYSYIAKRADTANYALVGGTADNAWVRGTPDSVLYTIRQLGIARGGSGNMLYGSYRYTHTNLGVACTTGTRGQDWDYCTVGGGVGNTASIGCATVAGGRDNTASGYDAAVGGGYHNAASDWDATVAGGYGNTASGEGATVGGGGENTASGHYATVGGGHFNTASDSAAAVAGGRDNTASANYATVAGGYRNTASGNSATVGGDHNTASGWFATVGGGDFNTASGEDATVAGGYGDTSAASCSFTTNYHSVVPSSYSNSAAFNGQTATASGQLRCGTLAKAGGTFTIDHPLDPYGKILNHYFVEGPEMLNIYRGSVVLDASGRAEVRLPDYFSTLNRNPHIQLTGVGTSDVYVAEDINGNAFVIGGKPGTKVYWQVTGERQDISAEVIRRMMPVEQPKTGELKGRMLDDDFLVGCMEQLEREGKAEGINFRTPEGRKRYEDMKIMKIRRKGE